MVIRKNKLKKNLATYLMPPTSILNKLMKENMLSANSQRKFGKSITPKHSRKFYFLMPKLMRDAYQIYLKLNSLWQDSNH
jgi:hypothetical protein